MFVECEAHYSAVPPFTGTGLVSSLETGTATVTDWSSDSSSGCKGNGVFCVSSGRSDWLPKVVRVELFALGDEVR